MLTMLKRIIIVLCTAASVWLAGFIWFVLQIPSSRTIDDAHTDAIVVLTGGSLRLEHGFNLLIDNKAPLLFVSGVEDSITLPALLRGKEVVAIADKVPQARVELGHYAHSTLQNAEETKGWSVKHGIKSIRLVTGSYHTPRSAFLLHQAMPEVSIIADPVFPAEFANGSWWYTQTSLLLVTSEYHKYIASRLCVMLGIISDE